MSKVVFVKHHTFVSDGCGEEYNSETISEACTQKEFQDILSENLDCRIFVAEEVSKEDAVSLLKS